MAQIEQKTYKFEKKLLNVKRGKQLALSINDDLARGLAWNGLEWFHDLNRKGGLGCEHGYW